MNIQISPEREQDIIFHMVFDLLLGLGKLEVSGFRPDVFMAGACHIDYREENGVPRQQGPISFLDPHIPQEEPLCGGKAGPIFSSGRP